jgi:hypothetical protein
MVPAESKGRYRKTTEEASCVNSYDFLQEIQGLIASKREGDYWDFKREHHNNKADLLHDILCMANSQQDHDCYIIFGVEDKTGNIVGVENDENRRNQQGVIDFLRSKKFAGDNRPTVEMRTIKHDEHVVDVLIVFNTLKTPFYLSEDYCDGGTNKNKTVKANAIYTRIGDTNTPINKTADMHNVEYLWKKRLGLHLTPLERFCYLLRDKSQWDYWREDHYNKQYQEYTILLGSCHPELCGGEFDSNSQRHEVYSYLMEKKNACYDEVFINYYGTTLMSFKTIVLDDGRLHVTMPDLDILWQESSHGKTIQYYYYIKESVLYLLRQYLFNQECDPSLHAMRRLESVVLVFKDENEHKEFSEYIKSNLEDIFNYEKMSIPDDIRLATEAYAQEYSGVSTSSELVNGRILVQKLKEYRQLKREGLLDG